MRLTASLVALALLGAACASSGLSGTITPGVLEAETTVLRAVDEFDKPISVFALEANDGTFAAAKNAVLELELSGPIAGVVVADGFLDAPVIIDPGRGDANVRMISRVGPGGETRRSFHFAGDTMLARRYLDGVYSELAPSDLGPEVVESVAGLFGAADHSSLNVESVVGELSDDAVTPGKRWTIQSPPDITSMLSAVGLDLAVLGNNHITDFEDAGVVETLSQLGSAGFDTVGAGLDLESAVAPRVQDVMGLEVATLSFLKTTGDFNNDYLPLTGDNEFRGLDPELDWQYESRAIDVSGPLDDLTGSVRPGDAWDWFKRQDIEAPELEARVWLELESVFPELQDSVVRRSHGGAAQYSAENLELGLSQLGEKPDLTVVQIHGGFQYMQAPPATGYRSARESIDLGADVVIIHHPHVFSGFEFYNGGLIAWGLGNFAFDQNLFATYGSGIVRLIFEEDRLLETSVIPMSLVDYRPIPVVGAPAEELVTRIGLRSRGQTVTVLADNGDAVEQLLPKPTDPLNVRIREDGLIDVSQAAVGDVVMTIGDDGTLEIPPGHLYVGREVGDVRVGVDLFGWGAFDQTLADGEDDRAPQWALAAAAGFEWNVTDGDGHLVYDPSTSEVGRVRTTSRIPIVWSRYYDDAGRPLQSGPDIEVELEASASWFTSFNLRLDMYHFSDRNPARYPINQKLSSTEFEATVGRSNTIGFEVQLPAETLIDDDTGLEATAMMLYIENPATRLGTLTIDDVRVIEWRDSDEIPVGVWVQANFVEGPPGTQITLVDLSG